MGDFQHYGVKGMKWGVRRTPEELGHRVTKKEELTFKLTKKKQFQVRVPQVKDPKMQKTIDFGAKMLEPYMSPLGLLGATVLWIIPGGLTIASAGRASYLVAKENGKFKKGVR